MKPLLFFVLTSACFGQITFNEGGHKVNLIDRVKALSVSIGDTALVRTSGSYSNPSWITALANSKITGLGAAALLGVGTTAGTVAAGNHVHTVYVLYTGATADLDMGHHGVIADFVSTGSSERPSSMTVRFAPVVSGAVADKPTCDSGHIEYYRETDTGHITSCDGVSWSSTLNPTGRRAVVFNSATPLPEWYNDAGELLGVAP